VAADRSDRATPRFERTFPAHPSSAGAARAFVSFALLDEAVAPDTITNAVLLTSEIVTYSLSHAGTPFQVAISVSSEAVRVAVSDHHRAVSTLTRSSLEPWQTESLAIVDRVSDGWGDYNNDGGKTTWFELWR
jgi:hypothetical protein